MTPASDSSPDRLQADAHKQKMEALQAEQYRKTKEAGDPCRGLVLIHTGDGKGKSSSAFGVVVRALGWGHRVGVVQFIKGDWVTGERQFFDRFAPEVDWRTMGAGFTWNTQNFDEDKKTAEAAFAVAAEMMASANYDLIVLDEINIALDFAYLDIDPVLAGLKARAQRTSVILTGRNATAPLIEYADLVSDVQEIKHPFSDAGIIAQKGIDF